MSKLFFALLAIILSIVGISEYNSNRISPSHYEKVLLTKHFGDITIKDTSDFIKVQNVVIDKISHYPVNKKEIDISKCLMVNKGLCYDRSMILQKIMLLNDISVIPVYLYFNNTKSTNFLDLFSKNVQSHSIFVAIINGNSVIVETNYKQSKIFKNMKDYITCTNSIPRHTKYVYFLSNRNGYFIYPEIIPDFYFAH